MKFIRVHGRVVPIKGKGSAPSGVSKRYGAKRDITKPKQLGVANGAKIGAVAGAALTLKKVSKVKRLGTMPFITRSLGFGPGFLKAVSIGALAGAAVGSVKLFKKGKGESKKQLAARAAGKKY